jgi:hypothetical protein
MLAASVGRSGRAQRLVMGPLETRPAIREGTGDQTRDRSLAVPLQDSLVKPQLHSGPNRLDALGAQSRLHNQAQLGTAYRR